jgi:DNA polymerase
VKHFKHEERGKRRLHKRPASGEIDQCRWWLGQELEIVKPKLVVAMGASAVRGIFGRSLAIGPLRGELHELEEGRRALVTTHPSAVLRMRDAGSRREAFRGLVDDLRVGARELDDDAT